MSKDLTSREAENRSVERAVSLVLRIGVLLSVALLGTGLALLLFRKGLASGMSIGAPPAYPRNLRDMAIGVLSLDPGSVLVLGSLVLIATPFTRVASSIAVFIAKKDWIYAGITSLVLAILLFSVFVGKITE
jgi:uncharacterized membrane protein